MVGVHTKSPEKPLHESGKAMETPYAKALDICCRKQQAWNGISPRKRLFVLQAEELERWDYTVLWRLDDSIMSIRF